MEAEVEGLRKQLEELQTATPDETDTISDIKKELDEKERALYTLQVNMHCERAEGGLAAGTAGHTLLLASFGFRGWVWHGRVQCR